MAQFTFLINAWIAFWLLVEFLSSLVDVLLAFLQVFMNLVVFFGRHGSWPSWWPILAPLELKSGGFAPVDFYYLLDPGRAEVQEAWLLSA